jgi:hypothetical protein
MGGKIDRVFPENQMISTGCRGFYEVSFKKILLIAL